MNWFRMNMILMIILGIVFTVVFWIGVGYITYLAYDKYIATPSEIVNNKNIKFEEN